MTKKLTRSILAVLLLMIFSATAFGDQEAGKQKVYKDIASLKEKIASEMTSLLADDVREHATLMKNLKAAGASYLADITTPVDAVGKTKDKDTRRILWGMYSLDSAYAAVFNKKKEVALKINAANDLARDLNLTASVMPALKKLASQNKEVTVDDLTDTLAREIEKVLPQVADSPKDVEFWGDAAYGGVIEGLYIVSEIIALNDYSPEMLKLLASQNEHIGFLEAIEIFKPHMKTGSLAGVCKRFKELEPVHQILLDKKIYTREDCEKIRKIVAPIRSKILSGSNDGDCAI
jgi:hypothetical protein